MERIYISVVRFHDLTKRLTESFTKNLGMLVVGDYVFLESWMQEEKVIKAM